MDANDPNIKNQDATYRRGLVLGLTMAEIMVLILFTLLLALTAALAARDAKIKERDSRISGLVALEDEVRELTEKNSTGINVTDIIQQIARQKDTIAELREEVARLEPFENQGKILEDIIREIRRPGGEGATPQEIVKKIKELHRASKENDNLRGQVAQMSRQIKASGKGNEFPSCWTRLDGKTQSIFEIEISSGGITVHDRDLPDRTQDKAELPISGIKVGDELLLGEFRNQVAPLYRWSVQQGCRFYVIRFSTDGNVRADLVNAIDSFFYPDSRIQVRPRR